MTTVVCALLVAFLSGWAIAAWAKGREELRRSREAGESVVILNGGVQFGERYGMSPLMSLLVSTTRIALVSPFGCLEIPREGIERCRLEPRMGFKVFVFDAVPGTGVPAVEFLPFRSELAESALRELGWRT